MANDPTEPDACRRSSQIPCGQFWWNAGTQTRSADRPWAQLLNVWRNYWVVLDFHLLSRSLQIFACSKLFPQLHMTTDFFYIMCTYVSISVSIILKQLKCKVSYFILRLIHLSTVFGW